METPIKTPHFIASMPGDEYHALDGISSTQVKDMAISPFNYWNKHINPDRPERGHVPAFVFGNLVHTMVLEPHELWHEFALKPASIDRRTKAGKAAYTKFLEDSQGKKVISEADYELALAMTDSVSSHAIARQMFQSADIIEGSGWWRDERTGLLCKFRPDAAYQNLIIDLKTIAGGVDYDNVQRQVMNFSYYTSAAWYMDGYNNAYK